jgi:uncharacterized protein YkwD
MLKAFIAIWLSVAGFFGITHPTHIPPPVVPVAARVAAPVAAPKTTIHATSTVAVKKVVKIPVQTTPATTTPTPAPTSTTNSLVNEIEQGIHEAINVQRTNNGLQPLLLSSTLASVARAHSEDMAAKKYFEHTDLSGCSSSCRVTNAGYAWTAVGENIFMEQGYKVTAAEAAKMVVDGWMNSAGHRANILNGNYTYEGIGVSQVGDSIYATEDFARPR